MIKANCQWCGREFEYVLRGQPKRYCDKFCANAYKAKNRNNGKKPRQCNRCGITKPRTEFRDAYAWMCNDCRSDDIRLSTCVSCGEEKERSEFPYWSKMCFDCKTAQGDNLMREDKCEKCKHNDNCKFLTARFISPLCWNYDDDLDPHYYEILPEVDRVRVAGIIGLRYYEKFKAVQGELM